MPYHVYLLRCADDTFYTGICTNLEQRLHEHNATKRGAKYTKTRRPVTLVYSEEAPDRSTAQRREHFIRKTSHKAKASLIAFSP